MDLQTLLDRLASEEQPDLAAELADLTVDQLKTLLGHVHDAHAELADKLDGEDVDEHTLTTVENLADISDAVTTAIDNTTTPGDDAADDAGHEGDGNTDHPQVDDNAHHRRERAAEAAKRLDTARSPEPAPTAPAGEPSTTDTPAAPSSPTVVDEPTRENEAPVNPTSNTPEPVPASAAPAQHETVALNRLPSNNANSANVNVAGNTARGRTVSYKTQAADIPGMATGAELADIKSLAAAATARMQGLSRVGPGRTAQAGIATISRQVDDDRMYVNDNDTHVVDQVCNEAALPGGSLVAAGCWCAPSETLYDMCPTASVDGLVDLPEVVTRRGGVRYPVVPDFSEIYSQIGFHFDCATIEGDPNAEPPVDPAEKPCYEIPCLDMVDNRLDVDGICIRTPILTERAWPELVEYFLQQALAAHAHKINAWVISKMVALATKVTINNQITDLANPHGPSATASILSVLELYVEHIKLKYRLPENTSLEMVAPRWLRGVLRADLSKRLCVDMMQVTDQTLDQYLASRGVRVQWVIDWQCAFAFASPPPQPDNGIIQPVGTGLGGPDYPQNWPTEVQILLYPAGSLFRMSADVISLDGVYDSQGLAHNEYTRMFSEEGVQVAKRCYEPVALTMPLCPNGGNQGGSYLSCTPAANGG